MPLAPHVQAVEKVDQWIHVAAPVRVHRTLQRGLDELTAKLARAIDTGASAVTAAQIARLRDQTNKAIRELSLRFYRELEGLSTETTGIALDQLGTYTSYAQRAATGIGVNLPLRQIGAVLGAVDGLQGTLLRVHQASVDRWGMYAISQAEGAMAIGLASGDSGAAMVQRVATAMDTTQSRAENIVRTELAGAAGSVTRAATDEIVERGVLPGLALRWTERISDDGVPMDTRVEIDSMAIHGQVAARGETFVMPPYAPNGARVPRQLAGKRWSHPPNRPRDRAAVVPWHPSWGIPGWRWVNGAREPVKHEKPKPAPKRAKPTPKPKHALSRKPKKLSPAGERRIAKAGDLVETAQFMAEHSMMNMRAFQMDVEALEGHLAHLVATGQDTTATLESLAWRRADLAKLQRITGKEILPNITITDDMAEQAMDKALKQLAKLKPHERAHLVNRQLAAAPEAVSSFDISPHWTQTRYVLQSQYRADGYLRMAGTTDNQVAITTRRQGVWGTHAWNGRITMDPEPAKMAQRFAQAYVDDPEGVRQALKEIGPLAQRTETARAKYYDMRKKHADKFTYAQERTAREWLKGNETDAAMDALGLSKTKRRQLERYVRARQDYFDALDAYEGHRAYALANDAQGLRTLVHEEWHEFSPAKGEAYRGPGIVVEEVSTELMARATMEADWGVPVRYSSHGSYGKYIDPMTDEVARIYGVSRKKARDILIDACSALKKQPGGVGRDDLTELFIQQFPPTGRGTQWDRPRNALIDRHGNPRPLYRYDLESKINELAQLPTV